MNKKIDSHAQFKMKFRKLDNMHTLTDCELKRLQNVELGMFRDFLAVAEKYDIAYSMSGGTALGTVRHKGFIPWDDDIDINLTRKSYKRFKAIFDEELGGKYELWAPELGRNHGLAHVQIKKKGTVYKSFNELSKSDNEIYIDIFIQENVPNNVILRKLHGFLCLAFGYLLTCRKTYNDMPYLKPYIEGNAELERAFSKKEIIGRLFSWLTLDTISKLTIKVYSMCKNNGSKFTSIPTGRKHYFGELLLRSDSCETIEMEFEGIKVRMPKGYDNYLSRLYGKNYMEIPPIEKREQHPLMELDFGEE